MKSVLLAATLLSTISTANMQSRIPDSDLPELHRIKTITLSPNYGCRTQEGFQKSYANTALFLSSAGKDLNDPDLLFNGACGGKDFFQAHMTVDDLTVIADLGKVTLEELHPYQVFSHVYRRNDQLPESYATFLTVVPVQLGHTYAVLVNKQSVRSLLYFTVVGHVPNQQVDLRYAVQNYQLMTVRQQLPDPDSRTKSW
jgi:hypothetical protein